MSGKEEAPWDDSSLPYGTGKWPRCSLQCPAMPWTLPISKWVLVSRASSSPALPSLLRAEGAAVCRHRAMTHSHFLLRSAATIPFPLVTKRMRLRGSGCPKNPSPGAKLCYLHSVRGQQCSVTECSCVCSASWQWFGHMGLEGMQDTWGTKSFTPMELQGD